jgi:hypothetical protein
MLDNQNSKDDFEECLEKKDYNFYNALYQFATNKKKLKKMKIEKFFIDTIHLHQN